MAHDLPAASGLGGLEAAIEGHRGLPPVERWNPPYCGDSAITIRRDGVWFHQGVAMTRPALVRLFSTLLRKDDEGFMLVTPVEKLSLTVEDAPFLAVAMRVDGEGERQALIFVTNVGDQAVAGQANPLRFVPDSETGAPVPYLRVRGGLEAKLTRPLYYALVEKSVIVGESLGVWSGGVFFALGPRP